MRLRWMAVVAGAAVGCGGASSESGLAGYLRLTGAQFEPGELTPAPDAMGPSAFASLGVSKLYPGVQNIPFPGYVEDGTSVLIGLAGDIGHWIVPAPLRDVGVKDSAQYLFSTRLSLSPDTPRGKQTLIVRGVDAAGTIGPSKQYDINVASPAPSGALVITLDWDTNADLDLHAIVPVDPNGPLPLDIEMIEPVEVWTKSPLALPPNPT